MDDAAADNDNVHIEQITIGKIKIEIDTRLISPPIVDALRRGYYETAETKIYGAMVTGDDVVVEIGGGIGYQSSFIWWARKPKKMVLFEGNPNLIPLIERNHTLNYVEAEVRNEIVVEGNSRAFVPFYIRDDFWASSLSPEPAFSELVEVPTIQFSRILRQYDPSVLLVDIEGGEVALFETIPLGNIKKIVVELHPGIIGKTGLHSVFKRLIEQNFYPEVWRSEGGVVTFVRL